MAVRRPYSGAIYPGVFLTSAAVLMLQVALTRLFSFTLWYHFAYVVISLALLGYGASGALLSAFPGLLRGNLPRTLFLCSAGAAIVIPLSLLVYAHTPFYPLQLFVQPAQWAYLVAYYAATGIPFFLAGVCVAGAISVASDRVTRVYCADLVGAGIGAGLVVPLIWRLETPGVVILAGVLMAGAAGCWAWWWRPRVMVAPLILIVLLAAGGGRFWRGLEFHPSVEKIMAIQLGQDGAALPAIASAPRYKVEFPHGLGEHRLLRQYTHWGAMFRVDVLECMESAMRGFNYYSIGASSQFRGPAPRLLTVPHDGDANALIYSGADAKALALFDNHGIALPYLLLKPQPTVLALGAGGGTEIVTALRHGAKSMTAVELDPLTARLVTHDLANYAGRLDERPGVRYVVGEGRSFVRRGRRRYDLIQINNVDSLVAASIGANVLNEGYLYTVEASREYLDHLNRDGILCLLHIDVPPDSGEVKFKLAMLRAGAPLYALIQRGVSRPQDHMAIIWARYLMTYLVRPRPFTPQEVQRLKRYCAENGFQPVHLPYQNLDNELSWFIRAPAGERARYMARSAMSRTPPTDDSPFVWPHYKWRYLLDPAHPYGRVEMQSGQLVLLPLLAVAILSALAFILAPLALFRRRGIYSPAAAGLAVYFAALGFGFMFIEISFIQKFVLFLGYPTYSLTVVLSALLVASGLGSLASRRLITRAERSLGWGLAGLLVVGGLYLAFGGVVFDAFLGYALWARIMVAVAMIAPLGFAMGVFFPTGVRVVNEVAPQFVPWAWGINASTSVVAAILAVMLAMTVGFRMVGLVSLAVYVIGVLGLYAARRRMRPIAESSSVAAQPTATV
jgi:hypothetical protein